MTLPYDIARCHGRVINRTPGPIASALFPDYVHHSQCKDCRRREPGPSDRPIPHMSPPKDFVGGKCPNRIAK